MRKGSELGSLGGIFRAASVAGGISLLILPIYVGTLAPTPAVAQEQPAPQSVSDEQAVRDAVQRRSGSWLDRANQMASRRRVVAVRRRPRKPTAQQQRIAKVIHTRATWYGPGFHGRRTASGERFNQYAMTLASRHLPFGTRVRVVNLKTGKSALARVNDRGPFRSGYTADLSKGLAFKIGMLGSGPIRLEILKK